MKYIKWVNNSHANIRGGAFLHVPNCCRSGSSSLNSARYYRVVGFSFRIEISKSNEL